MIFDYVYQYKDHLGNVRLSYQDINNNGSVTSSEIKEENNYYPFGLTHSGYNNVISANSNAAVDKYGFGTKELQDELGLEWMDFHARNYDASLGRWMNVDPLAEQFYDTSPYTYVSNNPLRYTDPTGMAQEDIIIKGTEEYQQTVLADLQQLTDDKLQIDNTGMVTIADSSCNDGCNAGGDLISELINHDKVVTIEKSTGGNETQVASWDGVSTDDPSGLGTGLGSDSTISYNPNKTTGGKNVNNSTQRPAEIGLAHELGHARNFANGTVNYGPSGIIDPDYFPIPGATILNKDELNVRKFENQIRTEQGEPFRKIKNIRN
jgi:RHS repeat-associated protein